jgi:hypothetical protein
MSLNDTISSMYRYLDCILKDLSKSERGNKAASQRVRTCSIKLEKIAKKYRKESVASEKKKVGKKKSPAKKTGKKSVKKDSPKRKVAKKPVRKVVKRKVAKKNTKKRR